jgi:hypothetical protein
MFKRFFNKKDFNFENYLVDELGYAKEVKHNYNLYTKGLSVIEVFKKERGGYNLVAMNIEDCDMATLRFIPNSRVMVDMIMSSIKREIYEIQQT